MNRHLIPSFLGAAFAGALIWAFSPMVTGHAEPWDADGVYYFAALVLAGLVSGFLAPKSIWMLYLGSVTGQFLYHVLFFPIGPLVVIGLAFLLAWSLTFLAGAYGGSRVRRRIRTRLGAA
jgi:4-hydroxybenzoate polyprenyltransferase